MKLTKEQQQELLNAATPLIKWVKENCGDYFCIAQVNGECVELVESVTSVNINGETSN